MQDGIEEKQKFSPMVPYYEIQKILNDSHGIHGFCEDLTQI